MYLHPFSFFCDRHSLSPSFYFLASLIGMVAALIDRLISAHYGSVAIARFSSKPSLFRRTFSLDIMLHSSSVSVSLSFCSSFINIHVHPFSPVLSSQRNSVKCSTFREAGACAFRSPKRSSFLPTSSSSTRYYHPYLYTMRIYKSFNHSNYTFIMNVYQRVSGCE